MAEPGPYEYRTLCVPRGADIEGAIAELHADADGLVTMDIRIPARQGTAAARSSFMAEHKVGNTVVMVGTIVAIDGDIALVQVDKSFPPGGTITVRLGRLTIDVPSDEDRIRDAMAEAQDHPGRVITR